MTTHKLMFSRFPIVIKVCMALMIYVTFALNFFIPFELVWHYIKRRYEESRYWLWQRVWRAVMVVIVTVIAVIFPAVTKFIGLVRFFSSVFHCTMYRLEFSLSLITWIEVEFSINALY